MAEVDDILNDILSEIRASIEPISTQLVQLLHQSTVDTMDAGRQGKLYYGSGAAFKRSFERPDLPPTEALSKGINAWAQRVEQQDDGFHAQIVADAGRNPELLNLDRSIANMTGVEEREESSSTEPGMHPFVDDTFRSVESKIDSILGNL